MAWAKELSSLRWEREKENCKKQVLFPGRWRKEPGPMCCPSRRMGESSLMQAGLAVTFVRVFWTLSGHARPLAGFVSLIAAQGPLKNSQAEPRVARVTEFQSHFLTVPCHGIPFQFQEPGFCRSMKWSLSFMVNESYLFRFLTKPSSSKLVSCECLYPSVSGIATLGYVLICLYVCHLPNLLTICCSKNSFLEGTIVT